jgi:hypothetical protein
LLLRFYQGLENEQPDRSPKPQEASRPSFYVNEALFTHRFRNAYHRFIDLCFIAGPLHEYDATAKLRTDLNIRRDMFAKRGLTWKPEWDAYFAPPTQITERDAILQAYHGVMQSFVQELGVLEARR